jgi:hypothetical protein
MIPTFSLLSMLLLPGSFYSPPQDDFCRCATS